MLLTLIKALNTTSLLEVVKHLSMSPLDIDLLLYDAQDKGEIKIDKKKGTIKALKEPDQLYYNAELASKLVKTIEYYDKQEANITRDKLESNTLDIMGKYGYMIHDFICTMYALERGQVVGYVPVNRYEISVPEIKKKRPAHTFVFYTFLDHQEFGSKAVNDFIDQWAKMNVKKS